MTEIKQRTTAEYQVSYFKVRLVIYLSYIVQGFALIILAQTVQQLSTLWQSSIASTTALMRQYHPIQHGNWRNCHCLTHSK